MRKIKKGKERKETKRKSETFTNIIKQGAVQYLNKEHVA